MTSLKQLLTLALAIVSVAVNTVSFAQGEADEPVVRFGVTQFIVEGDNPLDPAETDGVLDRYIGEYAGIDGLLDAAEALESAIAAKGLSFRRVLLPPQQLNEGVVKLQVVAFEISKIAVKGNEHFSEDNIRASVPSLQENEIPTTSTISRDLALANRNPYKQTSIKFRESSNTPNSLEADVEVEDKKPWAIFAGLSNVGDSSTAPSRLTLGYQASNFLDTDHVATVTYTTAPGALDDVAQFAASYSAPLPKVGGELTAYFVNSDVDTGRILDFFDVSGSGKFTGLSYHHELGRTGGFIHSATVSIDDKLFANNVVALGVNQAQDVRSRPVTVQYENRYQKSGLESNFRISYTRNTASGGGNNGFAYRANRAGADSVWDVVRLSGEATVSLPAHWALHTEAALQITSEPLIAGEQFGLGGARSVRGFDEREISGDDGGRASAELWAPPIDGVPLRFLFFLDGGAVRLEQPIEGRRDRDFIASFGGGVRYQWKQNVSVSIDIGQILAGTTTRKKGTRGHFNFALRY